jgi:asparagine synthetase B (glutamine-hydrolysing)
MPVEIVRQIANRGWWKQALLGTGPLIINQVCQIPFQLAEEFGFKYSTESDGESILHLYNHGGAEFMFKHLDGIFAICLLDLKEMKVIIGRDTYGVKPCFRFVTEHGFLAICSEVKGEKSLF